MVKCPSELWIWPSRTKCCRARWSSTLSYRKKCKRGMRKWLQVMTTWINETIHKKKWLGVRETDRKIRANQRNLIKIHKKHKTADRDLSLQAKRKIKSRNKNKKIPKLKWAQSNNLKPNFAKILIEPRTLQYLRVKWRELIIIDKISETVNEWL